MVASSARVSGARELAAELRTGSEQVRPLIRTVVDKSATDLVALTQRNASGRPGPRAPTGDYRGSWRSEVVERGTGVAGGWTYARAVGTDRPQANRLEYGFVGTDSIGRTYDQAPLPHHGPAVDVIEPIFRAAMDQVAERAAR